MVVLWDVVRKDMMVWDVVRKDMMVWDGVRKDMMVWDGVRMDMMVWDVGPPGLPVTTGHQLSRQSVSDVSSRPGPVSVFDMRDQTRD